MATPGLRERHGVETRQRIAGVAIGLFLAKGFEATTIDEIAAAADVSPRTFFRYFATKEALLFHGFDQRLQRITEHIEARPADERPLDTLTVVLCRMIDGLRSEGEVGELTFCMMAERPATRSYHHSTAIERAEQEIIEALARRTGAPDAELALRAALSLASSCLEMTLRGWIASDFDGDFEVRFRAMLDAYRVALGQESDDDGRRPASEGR